MKKTSDLSDHIKRTMPKRDIQEGRESVQMFVEMLKHHKIDVVDDEVLNRTYETEDYVDEKILSLILETLKIDEPIQYIPRYMRSMNAFQAGGTTVVVVDELLEYTLLSFLFTMYDYAKFIAVAPTELDDRFFLDNYETNKNNPLVFSKVRLKGTKYIEEIGNKDLVHNEIFVDVFPYYYISDNN